MTAKPQPKETQATAPVGPRERAAARKGCATCGAPVTAQFRPFCSKRCADIDLGRWLLGSYATPAEDQDPPAGEPAGEP